MEITPTYNDGQLTIAISGRVDATEATNFQNEALSLVKEYDNVESIVIDATQLTFISSLGLRVILMLKKKYDDLRIIGACPDVYNVFTITGFHKIINVEKALPNIDVEGCKQVSGRKDEYQLTEDTILKVFPAGTTKADVEAEVAMAKEAFVLGVPTAMAFDIVRVGAKYGLIYESTSPLEIDAIALGTMLRTLHEQKVDPDGAFPYGINIEKKRINALQPYLGDDAVSKLLQMLSVLPDATSLLHGNLSLSSIMKQNNEPIFTDMGSVCFGHPVVDLAHIYSSFTEEQKTGEYFESFLDEYYDMESDETIRRNRENIVALSMITDFTNLVKEGEPTPEAVDECKKLFKERVTDRWEEILSRLRFKMDFNEEIRKLERNKFYLDGDVNIDWVAKKLGTNRHYVSDYFNKVLHTTFNDYINNLRLEYAAQLLREGRVQKSQVAYDAGFNNDHTFRRLFKAKFDCLPSQYKENSKQ